MILAPRDIVSVAQAGVRTCVHTYTHTRLVTGNSILKSINDDGMHILFFKTRSPLAARLAFNSDLCVHLFLLGPGTKGVQHFAQLLFCFYRMEFPWNKV